MAAGQQKKRRNASSAVGCSLQQYSAKKTKKTKNAESSQTLLSLIPHISLKWDDTERKVVAKREQIGLAWSDLRPFTDYFPKCHRGLADVFHIPQEIFGLEDMAGVMSYEVWKTHLSHTEKEFLTQFLPQGTDAEQVVQELLSGENLYFGNPFLKWGASLCSGNLHPDAVESQELCFEANKKDYDSEQLKYHDEGASLCSGNLHPDAVESQELCFEANKKDYDSEQLKYHDDVQKNFLKWKERYASWEDPEKESDLKMWSSSEKHVDNSISSHENESSDPAASAEYYPQVDVRKVCKGNKQGTLKKEGAGVPQNSSSRKHVDNSISSHENESSDPAATAEYYPQVGVRKVCKGNKQGTLKKEGAGVPDDRKGYIKDRRGNSSVYPERPKVAKRLRKEEKQQRLYVRSGDTAKYMSYIKISKQQHALVKKMTQSGDGIQSKSLNHVLGDINSFCIQPYEAYEEEESKKLHKHWLQMAKSDLPLAFTHWTERKLQKQQWRMSLEQEISEKMKVLVFEDEEKENPDSLLEDSSEKYDDIAVVQNCEDDEESDPQYIQNQPLLRIPSLNRPYEFCYLNKEPEESNQDTLEPEGASPPPKILGNIESEDTVERGAPTLYAEEFVCHSTNTEPFQRNLSLNGHQELDRMDMVTEDGRQDIMQAGVSTGLTEVVRNRNPVEDAVHQRIPINKPFQRNLSLNGHQELDHMDVEMEGRQDIMQAGVSTSLTEVVRNRNPVEDAVHQRIPINKPFQRNLSLNGHQELDHMDVEMEGRQDIMQAGVSTSLTEVVRNRNPVEDAVHQRIPISSPKDEWSSVGLLDSYYDHGYTPAELSLRQPNPIREQTAPLIDLESDTFQHNTVKTLFQRPSNDMGSAFDIDSGGSVFGSYINHDRGDLQPFPKGQGMLSYYSNEHRQPEIQFLATRDGSLERASRQPLHFQEQQHQHQHLATRDGSLERASRQPLHFQEHQHHHQHQHPHPHQHQHQQQQQQHHQQFILDQRQQIRDSDMYMDQLLHKNNYSSCVGHLQSHLSQRIPVNVQNWAAANPVCVSAPLQSPSNGGGFLDKNWFSGEQGARNGWSGIDVSGIPGQCLGNRGVADQSLYSILTQSNRIQPHSYDSVGANGQYIPTRNFMGGGIPSNSDFFPNTSHQLNYLNGHEAMVTPTAAPTLRPNNSSWMMSPHQSSGLHDSIQKQFLRSWNS